MQYINLVVGTQRQRSFVLNKEEMQTFLEIADKNPRSFYLLISFARGCLCACDGKRFVTAQDTSIEPQDSSYEEFYFPMEVIKKLLVKTKQTHLFILSLNNTGAVNAISIDTGSKLIGFQDGDAVIAKGDVCQDVEIQPETPGLAIASMKALEKCFVSCTEQPKTRVDHMLFRPSYLTLFGRLSKLADDNTVIFWPAPNKEAGSYFTALSGNGDTRWTYMFMPIQEDTDVIGRHKGPLG